VTVVLTQIRDRGDDMHHGGSHGWWWLIAIVLLVLLVVAIVALFRRQPVGAESARTTVPSRSGAEALLAERLARGEIDADEYRRRRDALRE
jgi:putative membrane protein